MNILNKIIRAWLSPPPPTTQGALGPLHEREAFTPEPTVGEIFAGWWKGHPVYVDRPRRPIFLPDPRAERNRQAALERAKARGEERSPIWFLRNGRD